MRERNEKGWRDSEMHSEEFLAVDVLFEDRTND